jgi:hypothetical protein
MGLSLETAWKAISMLSPNDKIELIKSNLNLDSDLEYSLSPLDASDKFQFKYYGKTLKISLAQILENPLQFKDVINARILDAKIDSEQMEVVFEETSGATTAEEYKGVIRDMVSKAEEEDQLAEVFSRDFEAFREFYNSPCRRSLDSDVRSFLLDILNNPFPPIWESS